MSIKEFITKFYNTVGVDIPIKVTERPLFLLSLAGFFNKDIKEYAKMNYQRQSDWVVDDSLFRNTFTEWKSTDLSTAFKDTFVSFIN